MQQFGGVAVLALKQLKEQGAEPPNAEKLTEYIAEMTHYCPEAISMRVEHALDVGVSLGYLQKHNELYYPNNLEEPIEMSLSEEQQDKESMLEPVNIDGVAEGRKKPNRRGRKATTKRRGRPRALKNKIIKTRAKKRSPRPKEIQKTSKEAEYKADGKENQKVECKPKPLPPFPKEISPAPEKSVDNDDAEIFSIDSDMERELKRLLRAASRKRRGGRSRSRSRRRRGGSRRRRTRRRR